jgi:hypothetical protein
MSHVNDVSVTAKQTHTADMTDRQQTDGVQYVLYRQQQADEAVR